MESPRASDKMILYWFPLSESPKRFIGWTKFDVIQIVKDIP